MYKIANILNRKVKRGETHRDRRFHAIIIAGITYTDEYEIYNIIILNIYRILRNIFYTVRQEKFFYSFIICLNHKLQSQIYIHNIIRYINLIISVLFNCKYNKCKFIVCRVSEYSYICFDICRRENKAL